MHTTYTATHVSVRLIPGHTVTYDTRDVIQGPEQAVHLLQSVFADQPRECFVVLHLSMASMPMSYEVVSTGGLSASVVEPRAVFQGAILANAAALILAHNHPSGNPEPSAEDLAITRQLVESGTILGIPIRDHLILTGSSESYTSMARRGLI